MSEKKTYQYPDGHLLYRNLSKSFPTISHGKGVYLYDSGGKEYIDAAGGAFVTSVGHSHTEVVRKIQSQLAQVSYVNGNQFVSEAAVELAGRLAHYAQPLKLDRISFLSSGSEAMEAAVKFVRQLAVDSGEEKRHRLIARIPSYHGNTLQALALSGRPHYKKVYGPLLNEVHTVESPYRYRAPIENYEDDGPRYYADQLESKILEIGADEVLAFVAEPILGSSAGGSLPPQAYFLEIQKICRKYGVRIIADEVLCGSGRTGKFFASEHYPGFEPDVLILGKGLNGGYAPLSALLVRDDDVRTMQGGTGNFMHAQTYMHHPIGLSAGLAVLDAFEDENILKNCCEQGDSLHQSLKAKILIHPHVGSIDGRGLLAGIELVKDKETKTPFARSEKVTEKFVQKAFEKGLIVWPNVGQADGINGDLINLGPPLNIQRSEVDQLIERISQTLNEVF